MSGSSILEVKGSNSSIRCFFFFQPVRSKPKTEYTGHLLVLSIDCVLVR